MSWGFELQGHRGARGLWPENTIPGFLNAAKLGVDTLELDVVVTGDQRILVSHDPWFDPRITTRPDGKRLDEKEADTFNFYLMTTKEIQRFDVGLRRHPEFPKQVALSAQKPLLEEVFRAIPVDGYSGRPPIKYSIEAKSHPEWVGKYVPPPETYAAILLDELERFAPAGRILLQSFDPHLLTILHQMAPSIALSFLISQEMPMEKYLEQIGFLPAVWSPSLKITTAETVSEARKLGMRVIPWTVNLQKEMIQLLEWGVDGLITDYPDLALPLKHSE